MMRRRKRKLFLLQLIGFGAILLFFLVFMSIFTGAERDAKAVVHDFYELESQADFGRSWELLHTEMKARFDKGAYVQDRAHVFNGHFGADTFTFTISDAKKLENWKMEKEGERFGVVYEFEVKQEYHGKYGHFVFVQYVYVVEENGELRIVWDYKK